MATTRSVVVLLPALLLAAGCSNSNDASPASDGGSPVVDTGAPAVDSGASAVDSGPADTGVADGPTEAAAEAGPKCAYPAGPYGVNFGQVLPPTLTWQGYAPNATSVTTLKITDLYDCDGTKGINAIVFDSSAQWCIACQYEAGNIPSWLGSTGPNAGDWNTLGVQIVTLMIQTNSYEPASVVTADQWRMQYALGGLPSIWVVADPDITFPTPSLPHNMLVDPRTMKVTDDLDNDVYDASFAPDAGTISPPDPAVAALATTNKK